MKKSLVMFFFICAGIVVGSLVAHLTSGISWLKWISFGMNFGLTTPFTLDLSVLTLTFGISFNLSISIILFLIIFIFIGMKVNGRRR